MFYVGIDIAKETHVASVIDSDGVVHIEGFSFENNFEGFASFKKILSDYKKENVVIGLESTAHYAENLIFFLHNLDYKLTVINPISVSAFRNTKIRKTKNDKVDSVLIAEYISIHHYRLYSEADITSLQLKHLCRFRKNLKKSIAKLKTQLVSYVDLLFPELQGFFKSGLHIKTCYDLLKEYPSAEKIAALNLKKLTNLLKKSSRGRFDKEHASKLKSLAKSSVGVKDTCLSIQITQTIAQIELIDSQLNELDKEISAIADSTNSVLLSVPGIGKIDAAIILGEIGDIHRFKDASKLLAFAGLDPVVKQSGKFKAEHTRMSKRGSKLLRFALINAAWNCSLNNDTFNRYYNSKRAKGKNHYNALGHAAHKLVRVIFKLLSENITFSLV